MGYTHKVQRGIFKGTGISRLHHSNLTSIILIAHGNDVDPRRLFYAFCDALKSGSAYCGSLRVSRRVKRRDSAMFLITKEKQIVCQLPISLNVLTDVRVRNIINSISLPKPRTSKIKRSRECRGVKVNQLRFGMRGVAIRVKVMEVSPPKEVATRWGGTVHVSNVKVADETGMIRLVLWNDRAGIVHVGDVVTIKNFHVAEYAGALQLKLRRRGSISPIRKKWRNSHGEQL